MALRPSNAFAICSLLNKLTEQADQMSSRQMQAIGSTARRLLDFAWHQTHRDWWLVTWSLRLVCRSFKSDPTSSAAMLRQALKPDHMERHAFEEMPWIAREAGSLVSLDPDLVEDVYRAAFSHKETSDAPTPMGTSKILVLTSNRRQDFRGALYELGRLYPEFLRKEPTHAARALISALEGYVAQEHSSSGLAPDDELFDFEGRTVAIRTDYSSIWDSGVHVGHDALTLLNEFEKYLRELSVNSTQAHTRRQLLDAFIATNRLAAIWRRALIVGAAFPQTFGQEIRCLAWAKPILTSFDTSKTAGDFLRAIFATLPIADRERIERVIFSIPSVVSNK